jgi:hypothetical protein
MYLILKFLHFKYSDCNHNKIRWPKSIDYDKNGEALWCAAYCYNTEETKGR